MHQFALDPERGAGFREKRSGDPAFVHRARRGCLSSRAGVSRKNPVSARQVGRRKTLSLSANPTREPPSKAARRTRASVRNHGQVESYRSIHY
jgi:hypothetical protein